MKGTKAELQERLLEYLKQGYNTSSIHAFMVTANFVCFCFMSLLLDFSKDSFKHIAP